MIRNDKEINDQEQEYKWESIGMTGQVACE